MKKITLIFFEKDTCVCMGRGWGRRKSQVWTSDIFPTIKATEPKSFGALLTVTWAVLCFYFILRRSEIRKVKKNFNAVCRHFFSYFANSRCLTRQMTSYLTFTVVVNRYRLVPCSQNPGSIFSKT